jgi:hypothetical protein
MPKSKRRVYERAADGPLSELSRLKSGEPKMNKTQLAAAAITAALAGAAHAAVPKEFQGYWRNDVTSLSVTATTIHEPGYGCDIKKTKRVQDPAGELALYQINMVCRDEGPKQPSLPVKSLWAIRKTSCGDVLIITTLPDSIQVFQRDNS